MAFRSEGAGFSGGLVDGDEPRGFNFDVDHDYFERVVWPAAAQRFPPFEAAKCHRTWAGLYEQCELDGNPIIGNWPGRLDNFHVVRGLLRPRHDARAGRRPRDRRADRRRRVTRTLDLARFGYARVMEDRPIRSAASCNRSMQKASADPRIEEEATARPLHRDTVRRFPWGTHNGEGAQSPAAVRVSAAPPT